MGSDKKKKGKGKGSRAKFLLAVFVVLVVGLIGAYTWRTGVLPFEGGKFKEFITFQWVSK